MKVLYTFYHGSAFAWSLVHRLSVHQEDEAYLLVAEGWDWNPGKPRFLSHLLQFVKHGFFKKIYLYDNRLGRDAEQYNTLEKTENAILSGMDMRLLEQGCDISEFDYIYSNTDGEDTMGIYLAMKKINFYWFETAANGLMLRSEKWIRDTYSAHIGYQAALLKYKTLYGGNEHQSYILYPNSDSGNFPGERCLIFHVEKAAALITKKQKESILRCFGLDGENRFENITMLLLQSNWLPNLIYSSEEYIKNRYKHHYLYMYSAIQCMLDYYVPAGTVPVLKTHPTVIIDEKISSKYFNGIYAFPSLFTVLLMKTLTPEIQPECRIMLGSTANKQIPADSKDIYCPGVWLFPEFYLKYYVVLNVLNKLGCLYQNVGERFETIGASGTVMNYNNTYMKTDINHMLKLHFPETEEAVSVSYTILQTGVSNISYAISNYDFVIITDIWGEELLYKLNKDSNINIAEISIEKETIKETESVLLPIENECIYLVTKDITWIDTLKGFSLKKINEYSGFKISSYIAYAGKYMDRIKESFYPLRNNILLYDCYQKFGREYMDLLGNKISIGGDITKRALENMKMINVRFSGNGNNIVRFEDLNTQYEYKPNFRLEVLNGGKIRIGRLLFSNSNVLIHAANSDVNIEDDVMFSSNVVVRAMNYHSIYDIEGKRLPKRNVEIGGHVWLGYGTTIYAGTEIGSGTVTGPGTVTGGRLPNNCIAVGNPARVVRKNIFWQFNGDARDYYELPETMQAVNQYIKKTEYWEENSGENCSGGSNEIK